VFYFINEDLGVRKGLVAAIRKLRERGEEVHVLDIGTGIGTALYLSMIHTIIGMLIKT